MTGSAKQCCADSTCIVLSIFASKYQLMLQAHTSYVGVLLGAGHTSCNPTLAQPIWYLQRE